MQEREPAAREWDVEPDPEGGRRQYEAAHARRIVVRPCRRQDCADALRDHRDVFEVHIVRPGNVAHEYVDVLY